MKEKTLVSILEEESENTRVDILGMILGYGHEQKDHLAQIVSKPAIIINFIYRLK